MEDIVNRARASLAQAEQRKAERLALLDPELDAEAYAEAKAARPQLALIEVSLAEWRVFLKAHKPQEDGHAMRIWRDLVAGAAGAAGAQQVYVQAADALAIHAAAAAQPA